MTEEWKALTDVEKVDHNAASDREKQRYEQQMRVYKDKKAREAAAAAAHGGEVADGKVVGKKRPATAPVKEGKGSKKVGAPAAAPAAPV